MKITEEQQKKARNLCKMIRESEPEVLYLMSDFMDLDFTADEGMFSPSLYDALDNADVYSTDGKEQNFILCMGMSLPDIKVKVLFQDDGDETYSICHAEITGKHKTTEGNDE